ncbi:ABC transporter ATP-binding protein [Pinirhizobacter soli]|uniref:ABC transporter ATP-binding protein n=1 Tax=Pinirhizobacter soli TaxID=2786953 RepID=UPI00202A80FE|nr:ABC transporter ATP-binding protein [Pinirhizobacter soli]
MTDPGTAGVPPPEDLPTPPEPSLTAELGKLASGIRQVFGSHFKLFGAEVRLAKSGIMLMLFMALGATTFAVALGFTLLALLGWALAQWFGSWAWALGALALIQLLLLLGAITVFRRCMAWLGMPVTRAEVRALIHEATERGREEGEEHERLQEHRRRPPGPG